MTTNGVIVRKLAERDETLRRLREHRPSGYDEFVNDWGR